MTKIVRRILAWGTIAVVLLVVVYLAMVLRLALLEPTITFDAFERANAMLPEAPADRRAWPIYREAMSWERDRRLGGLPLMHDAFHDEDAIEEHRETLIAVLRERQDELAALRRAASLPVLGVPVARSLSEEDRHWFAGAPVPARADARVLYEVELPQLSTLRTVIRLLRADSELALRDGDGGRAVDDLIAMLGAARHAGETRMLVSQMVAASGVMRAADQAVRALERSPEIFDDDDLLRLQEAFAAVDPATWRTDLSLERLAFDDLVQRVYSDDGRGGGVLLPEAFLTLFTVDADAAASGEGRTDVGALLLAPITTRIVADRRETMELGDRLFALAESEADLPILMRTGLYERELDAVEIDPLRRRHAGPTLMLPAVGKAVEVLQSARMNADGAIVAIALERRRRERGDRPAALDELVPAFIPVLPLDAYDGKPLRYRRDPSGAILWSVGPDGIDHGGELYRALGAPDRRRRHPYHPFDVGDIILYDGRAPDVAP